MKQKIFKTIIGLFVFSLVALPALTIVSAPAQAGDTLENRIWGKDIYDKKALKGQIKTKSGLAQKDPREVIAGFINGLLGFLGIIAVVIIVLGGFKYMTSQGDESKVDDAKKLMVSGVIGLIIIVAAFGLATFVINALVSGETTT